MGNLAGEAENGGLKLHFDARLRLESRRAKVTTDAGLLAVQDRGQGRLPLPQDGVPDGGGGGSRGAVCRATNTYPRAGGRSYLK